jgi:hypothetical protein
MLFIKFYELKNQKNSVKIHIFAITRMYINRGEKVPKSGVTRMRRENSGILRMCISLTLSGYDT